jgi:hypothetical protein
VPEEPAAEQFQARIEELTQERDQARRELSISPPSWPAPPGSIRCARTAAPAPAPSAPQPRPWSAPLAVPGRHAVRGWPESA